MKAEFASSHLEQANLVDLAYGASLAPLLLQGLVASLSHSPGGPPLW